MGSTIIKPVFTPEINFNVQLLIIEERATIIHCILQKSTMIRIWKTTYLVQEDGNRKNLLHVYNIPEHPTWKNVEAGHTFTLIFEALDKNCKLFNLEEQIPEPGGFIIKRIKRNKTDVYKISL